LICQNTQGGTDGRPKLRVARTYAVACSYENSNAFARCAWPVERVVPDRRVCGLTQCGEAGYRRGVNRGDRCDLGDGLRKLCEALFAAGATRLYPGVTGSTALGHRDDLKKLPEIVPSGLASLMTIHLFSSCPMGEDQSKCAADSFGRVHGFKNLHLADASLLCTAPGVNPQGSIMALARRHALHFLAQRRS
jgi:choline dehydrogenase-like flavoprotein